MLYMVHLRSYFVLWICPVCLSGFLPVLWSFVLSVGAGLLPVPACLFPQNGDEMWVSHPLLCHEQHGEAGEARWSYTRFAPTVFRLSIICVFYVCFLFSGDLECLFSILVLCMCFSCD